MNMIKVLKPFNTATQRFKAGDEIPADADLTPHTLKGLSGRFIEADRPKGKSKPAD